MNANQALLRAALVGSLLSGLGVAAPELIELHPLPRTGVPVPTKVVSPTDVPAQYRDAIIKLSFTVDTEGVPRGIRVQEVEDPALTDSLVSALAQWRFAPASRGGVAVSMNVVLPLKLSASARLPNNDRQIGAVAVATLRNGRKPVRPDLDTHEALLHVNVFTPDGKNFVLDGMSEAEVRKTMGAPKIIAANVWSYANGDASWEEAQRHGCDTILISFQNHRVATIVLANERAIKFAETQLQYEPGYLDRILQGMHEVTKVAQN